MSNEGATNERRHNEGRHVKLYWNFQIRIHSVSARLILSLSTERESKQGHMTFTHIIFHCACKGE